MLTADPIRFNQILYNLLSNAVKFTPDNGRIAVTAKRVPSSEFRVPSSRPQAETTISGTWDPEPGTASASEFAEIAVADTGIGIKPEDLSKLFQRFTQLKHLTTKQHQGVGLGLALTKQLVELHGGTIRVHSDGEGRGSIFTVCLPLAELQAVPQLLVVDDDKNLLEAIRDALEAAGYQVKTAEDGAAALAQVEAARPDLLILDLHLPIVDGWEVLRRVRDGAATCGLPVLAITGVDVERSDQALTAGADEFLSKPFSMTVLEATVQRILQQGASAEHLRARQMHRLNLMREPTMRVGAPEETKILVVEDHPRGRRLVVDLLAAEGYTVLQAESGVGLLDRVKRERPNMILLDLQLPEIDGLTLARQLKADPETKIIPLLAITAYAQPEDHAKALAAGFADYLTKPLDTERFIQTVGRVLGR
jgi:CheY-like chemotaxis protein